MHKSRKRWAAPAAVLTAAVLALTGCGANSAPATEDGKSVVTFWQQKFEDYQQAWFKEQVEEYNASQDDVVVKLQVVPADTWDQKLKAAQAAGKQPDVRTTSYGNIKPGVANGHFAELGELMDAEAFDDIQPNVQDFVTSEGGYYAYPLLVEPSTVLFYRTDLFEAAGLDPDTPPTSWAELVEASRALTKDGVYGMNIGQVALDLAWSSWGLQYNAAGDLPIAEDWSEANATDPAYLELADFYGTLYQEKLMPQEATYPYADCSFYGEGTVAMSACGSWAIGQLSGNPDWKEVLANTAVAAFPSADGDQTTPTSTLGGWTLTVDAKSKAKEGAADFISWLVAGEPERMVDFFKASGYSKYPARISVGEALAADPEASGNPFLTVVSETILPYAKAEPAYPWDISVAFGTALEKAMKGGDAAAAFEEAQVAIDGVIEKQKLAGTNPQ
ncbi:extracellular solute-binding protein [Agromyces albus]|uniref:extracellular solute-binding protein n=1 Tax=Agromyces albus TaxID=205332 RepID=UPI0027823187|nr:extracellular solute-binding protein [Agromyces albus]MDQ0574906.1 multiple sugar transport system substrate-binding protein [Agromyces albus]